MHFHETFNAFEYLMFTCFLDPCRNYQTISDNSRSESVKNRLGPLKCDKNITHSVWYRFINNQGDDQIIPNQCIPMSRCQTLATGWMKGEYPTGIILYYVIIDLQLQVRKKNIAAKY